jgi:hypothetical protein
MAQILELPQLVDKYGMPEMQVRRGRIEPGLDPQGPSALQPVYQFGLDQDFFCATLQQRQIIG